MKRVTSRNSHRRKNSTERLIRREYFHGAGGKSRGCRLSFTAKEWRVLDELADLYTNGDMENLLLVLKDAVLHPRATLRIVSAVHQQISRQIPGRNLVVIRGGLQK